MKGIDISMHNNLIDFNKVKADGVQAVIIKATEGVQYVDPCLDEHYKAICGTGLAVGFYHFMSEKTEPVKQAIDFYNAIKDKEYNIIPVLDIESNTFSRSKLGVTDRCIEFLEKFKELSGIDCIVYTYVSFANDYLDIRLSKYKLWIAHYGVDTPGTTLAWGTSYIGHQYSEKGSVQGINGNVDLNNFTDGILLNSNSSVNSISSNVVEEVGRVNIIEVCKNFIGKNCGKLQYILKAIGYDLKCDNDFGEITYNAVIDYQSKRGIIVDGKAGARTFEALEEDISKIVCGIKYRTPEATRLIQYLLNINIDGIFLKGTEAAVKTFQSANGLVNDEIVGQNTWSKLLGL